MTKHNHIVQLSLDCGRCPHVDKLGMMTCSQRVQSVWKMNMPTTQSDWKPHQKSIEMWYIWERRYHTSFSTRRFILWISGLLAEASGMWHRRDKIVGQGSDNQNFACSQWACIKHHSLQRPADVLIEQICLFSDPVVKIEVTENYVIIACSSSNEF